LRAKFLILMLPGIPDKFKESGLHGEDDYTGLLVLDRLGVVDGNGRFFNPEAYLVFNLDGHRGLLDLDDPAMDTSDGDHFLTLLERFPELFLVLGTLHLGADEEEIENNHDKQEGKE
jgi:hypothetical protein